MGARNPNRMQRLRSLKYCGPRYVWLAVCDRCRHIGALPVWQLLRRFGELAPLESATVKLRATNAAATRCRPALGAYASLADGGRDPKLPICSPP
jgi:hypothetical protein